MEQLIKKLREETSTFHQEHLEKVRDWAISYFNLCKTRAAWQEVDWCKYFGIEPEVQNKGSKAIEFLGFPRGFYNTYAKLYKKEKDEIYDVLKNGSDNFIQKRVIMTELHYENSLIKLADRIIKKGINLQNFLVSSYREGINLEIVITDGTKTVRAWTIVAGGSIQCNHYRYLVK